MPFKSKQQAKYLFATDPKLAREFARKTKNIKKLPKKMGAKKGNSPNP